MLSENENGDDSMRMERGEMSSRIYFSIKNDQDMNIFHSKNDEHD